MKLSQLLYFQTVCQYNSVTKAASVLNVAQPSISAAIRNLEDEFGVNLFRRVKQRLILTYEGAFMLKYANEILEMSGSLEQKMIDLGQNRRHIRIGVPPMSGTFAFNKLFLAFQQEHPQIKTEIIESTSSNNLMAVTEESIDIGIASRVIVNEQLNVLPLREMRITLCVSPHHPLAEELEITFEQLADVPLILFRRGSRHNELINKGFSEYGLKPNVLLYSSQIYTIREFVSNGLACAFVFGPIAELFSDLIMIPVVGLPLQTVTLIWKKERYLINSKHYLFFEVDKFVSFARNYTTSTNESTVSEK
jgi:DNA-binding transcriptional LysR family regulator